mgnify:CR=1 FL=1
MPSITIDNIEYNLPPVVYDVLMATADERDGYRDQVAELDAILRRSKAVSEVMARVAALEAELQSFADAKYTTWDDGYNTPQDFVAWVQSRSRHLLNH